MTILLAFLIFWQPVDCDGYRVYRSDSMIATTQDTCYQDAPGPGTFEYSVTAFNAAGESGHTPVVTGTLLNASRPGDITFTGVLNRGVRSITLLILPAPEAAWIVGGGVYACIVDYDSDAAVTLSDLAVFGIVRTDITGDAAWNLSDFAAFGNLYQWRLK